MKAQIFVVLAALCSAAFPTRLRADIAPDPLSGGISLQTIGREPYQIALRHNTVKIKVTPDLCSTRAFFRLHNMGAATTLEVGFPLMYEGESKDFQLWIDGQPAAFQDKIENYVTPIGQPRPRHWKAWKMKFGAAQTQLVEVRYSNAPAEGYLEDLGNYGRYPIYRQKIETDYDYDLADYGYGKRQMLSEWAKIKMMEYILVSGSYWKGPIERCRVEADIAALPYDGIIRVAPLPTLLSPRQIVWEWENVEPTHNVRFLYLGASPRRQIIPYLQKILQVKPDDEALRQTLELMTRDLDKISRAGNF